MTTRDYKIDNVKYYLIFLVVFGHVIASYNDLSIYGYLLKVIFMFHMPLFIFIAGYFSRLDDDKYYNKIIAFLFIPYFILDTYYTVFDYYIYEREVIHFYYSYPNYALWFLLSLATWRLLLPMVTKIPGYVTVSFIAGLLVGFADDINAQYSLSRTIYFFPFFLLGYRFRKMGMTAHDITKNKYLIVVPAVLLVVLIYFLDFRYWLLMGVKNYSDLSFSSLGGVLVRGGVYIGSLIMSSFFLLIMPSRVHVVTTLGRATFVIYVYHIAFIMIFRGSGFSHWLRQYVVEFQVLFLVLFALVSFSITWLTGNRRVSPFLRKMVIPDFMLRLLKLAH